MKHFPKVNLEVILCLKVYIWSCEQNYATVYTSEDVCWNIRNVKLKFYSFPARRLYFPKFITAYAFCFFLDPSPRPLSYSSGGEPKDITPRQILPFSNKGKNAFG